MTNDMTMTSDEIEINSTWGSTTKAMRRAVARVREDWRRDLAAYPPDYAARIRRLYALTEINVRFKKCGEVISRDMMAIVGKYYQADLDELWAQIIKPYGGPEQVSPDFRLDPSFLNPRINKKARGSAPACR